MSTLSTEGKSSDGGLSSDRLDSEGGTYTEMTSVTGSEELNSAVGALAADHLADANMSDDHSTSAPNDSEHPALVDAHDPDEPLPTERDMEMLVFPFLTSPRIACDRPAYSTWPRD